MLGTGAYHILYQGQTIGRENWDLIRAPGGGYQLNSYISLAWPLQGYGQIRWLLDGSWQTQTLDISFDDSERVQAMQSSIFKGQWITRRIVSAGRASETRLPLSPRTQIDFSSSVFPFVLFRRLGIEVGTTLDVELIAISLPDLSPQPAQERLVCLGSESLEVPAGRFSTYHFTITSADTPHELTHLWVTAQGFVARSESSGGEDAVELIHFEM